MPKTPELRDSWDTWLEYASWLSAQGDERGELLVLGNTLASSPEDEALRAEIDEQAIAWHLDCNDLSDADEDLLYGYWDMAKGFRRFRNTIIPKDLVRLFQIPSAQIISTLPISGDPDAPASSVLGHHIRDIQSALIAWFS